MSWKHLGTQGLGRLIESNVDLAAYLAARCREAGDLEALPPEPALSVVCFRHLPPGHAEMPPEAIDAYQSALQRALEVSGEAWVSTTTLRSRTYLRAGIVNYLSTASDIDRMLEALRRLSEGVLEELDCGCPGRAARRAMRTLATSKRTAGGLESAREKEHLGYGPQLGALACRDRLVPGPEHRAPPRLHLAEDEGFPTRQHEVELTDTASPVAGDRSVAAALVGGECGFLS